MPDQGGLASQCSWSNMIPIKDSRPSERYVCKIEDKIIIAYNSSIVILGNAPAKWPHLKPSKVVLFLRSRDREFQHSGPLCWNAMFPAIVLIGLTK